MSAGIQARLYLRRRHHGVLCTLSKKFAGYPFGSVTPYVPDHAAHPVVLVSRLAEHTGNIEADTRGSLLIHDAAGDVQAGARLTLVGNAARLADQQAIGARYLRYLPAAARLVALGDFAFYAIAPVALRFIGGFGDIHWVSAASYAPPANQLAAHEAGILAHMNADHAQNLRDYCRHYHGRTASEVEMVGTDCDGFDVRADGQILRFDFERPVLDAMAARQALVAMAKKAQAA